MKIKAIEKGYLLFGTKSEVAAYQNWCKANHQPVISAERRGKYARIAMDLIWCEGAAFNEEPLFLEKICTVHDYVCSHSSGAGGGIYTEIDHVAIHYAEFVVKAYLAIYQQTIGQSAQVPAFPIPEPDNTFVPLLAQAKAQRYFVASSGNVSIPWRWECFCRAYTWPYIYVNETRRGNAKLEVRLPESVQFAPETREDLRRAGAELGLKSAQERKRLSDKWYLFDQKGLYVVQAIPTTTAIFFAQAIVTMLPEQEYFPLVDESWHA